MRLNIRENFFLSEHRQSLLKSQLFIQHTNFLSYILVENEREKIKLVVYGNLGRKNDWKTRDGMGILKGSKKASI